MSIDSIQQLRKLITKHFEDLNNILVEPVILRVKELELPNIIWSNANSSALQHISYGVPNAAYYDYNLDGIVKFSKITKSTTAILIDTKISKEEVMTDNNFMDYINKTADELTKYSSNINTLPTFCHIKGYVVYHNIIHKHNNELNVASSPLLEYLKDFKDIYAYDSKYDWSNALHAFLDVVLDFNKFNTTFMYSHGDLQSNCRNMMYNKNTNTFKVIDIEKSKSILSKNKENLSTIWDIALKDVTELAKCYNNIWKPINFTLVSPGELDNLIAELRAAEDHLWCVEEHYNNNKLTLSYHPFKEKGCSEMKDIYMDMYNHEVQNKIISVIDEQYDKLISYIKNHIAY
jgi:hypothetical protein